MLDTPLSKRPIGLYRRRVMAGLGLTGIAGLLGCASEPPTYASGPTAERESALGPEAPTLFFVESQACPNCMGFKQTYLPPFESSKDRAQLRLIVLHSPTISVRAQGNPAWVGDNRWVLDEAEKHGLLMSTPLFILTRGRRYLLAGAGLADWKDEILPAIHKEVSTA